MLKRSSIVKRVFARFLGIYPTVRFFFTKGLPSISFAQRSSIKTAHTHRKETMIEVAEPLSSGIVRATARPKVVHLWRATEEDQFTVLERRFADWINRTSTGEDIFKKHVYDNPKMNFLDLRQHRSGLYGLLAEGEELAVDFIVLKAKDHPKQTEIDNFVIVVDQKLNELRKVLYAWHGDLDDQDDIPQSFKDAIHELERGETEPLDDILEEKTA